MLTSMKLTSASWLSISAHLDIVSGNEPHSCSKNWKKLRVEIGRTIFLGGPTLEKNNGDVPAKNTFMTMNSENIVPILE